ncbi:hypothetical protein Asi02nite_30770 [Asanoa siamensis]|uniref:Lipoprotein LprG n=1 Tax=Asanoa siamensis TaxID=926357 RepID=A0ABQ4CQK2_9ACTN|nr:hypothetical protein Asi02nite_30770 [Asanoa siamensis]
MAGAGVGLVSKPAALNPPAMSVADAANLRLAAAVNATVHTSFRLKVSTSLPQVLEGEYDPAGSKGYLRSTSAAGEVWEFRIIGDDGYLRSGPRSGKPTFQKLTGVTGFPIRGGVNNARGGSPTVDPAELLRALESRGRVKDMGPSGSGANAVNTYVVSTDSASQDGQRTESTTVMVGVDSGKVSKIVFNAQVAGHDPLEMTLEFSGYGLVVNVERP